VSIPFYFYLSYLLEIEEKRRTFRANVIGFLRGVSEEIRRSTREHNGRWLNVHAERGRVLPEQVQGPQRS
ncbi:hypothetical protein QMK70_29930, partial [Klebsiella pneumoniae]